MTLTLRRIKKEIHHLDSTLSEDDTAFKTAMILFAALEVGANEKRVMEFTGLDRSFVAPRAKRLRENRVWVRGKTHCEWFGENGSIAFWADVFVAEGLMKRVRHDHSSSSDKSSAS